MVEEIFLSFLIDKAWELQTLALPNPSVGAMVVDSLNHPLSYAIHQKSGEAHAELEAIKSALITLGVLSEEECKGLNPWELYELILSSHQNALKECSIFVTLEPCNHEGKTPSCAKLLADVGVKKVVFATSDLTSEAKGGAEYLQSKGIEVVGGVCESKAKDLLYPFLCLQEKGHFNLYKIAQRLNANYKEGQISNEYSKAFTHTQRGVAQSLIISGKTLLSDQPRLDLRHAFRKDREQIPVKILTTQNLEPKDYACICSDSTSIHHHIASLGLSSGFNLIEGGYHLLESLRGQIDALLLILAPHLQGESEKVLKRMDFKPLHCTQMRGGDAFLWLQA